MLGPQVNQHDLSRYIPSEVKRQVRQECGFGCVTCGNAIAQYEHIDPEFNDAKAHETSKIAYLCGTCHDKVTRGIWSKEKIKQARANPITFKHGVSRDFFDIAEPFGLVIGSCVFTGVTNFISFENGGDEHEKILYVEPPEEGGAPFRLSGRFFDSNGKITITIDQNELIVPNDLWDIEIEGREFKVRSKKGDISLQIIVEPPNRFIINRMNMMYRGVRMTLSPGGELILYDNKGVPHTMSNVHISGGVPGFTAIVI